MSTARRVTDALDPIEGHGPMLGMTCSTCHGSDDADSLVVRDGRFLHPCCEVGTDGRDDVDRIYPSTPQARSIEDDSR